VSCVRNHGVPLPQYETLTLNCATGMSFFKNHTDCLSQKEEIPLGQAGFIISQFIISILLRSSISILRKS